MFDENYTPPPTPASSFTFSYRSANHTASIRRFVGSETEVVIPSTVEYNGATYKVTAIADGNIGTGAFYNSNITSVVIPDTVTSIGNYAFSGCDNLAMVNFGENSQLTSIGDGAFEGCSRLTSITIPSRVTSISFAAFHSCSSLTSITIPEGVTSIGDHAFGLCSSLTSITIGEGVISIGNDAFGDCYALAEVYNYSSLTITAGSSLNDGYLGQYAKVVYNASDLTGEKPETRIKDNNGVRYYDDGENTVVALYPLSRNVTTVSFDSRTTEIQPGAFNGCSSLTSITIPSSVTSIGNSAFYGCSGLTSITIPSSVTSIGSFAFFGCNFNAVTIDSSYAYQNAGASSSTCGYLLQDADTVYVNSALITELGTDANSYLNENFGQPTDNGNGYYVYTRNA